LKSTIAPPLSSATSAAKLLPHHVTRRKSKKFATEPLAILSTGSTVEAAHKLNMTQSAVSKQIATLEITLNTNLFARRPGGLAPTEAAKMYEPHARIAMDTLLEGAARLDDARQGPRALLLHLVPIIGERWLTDRFPEFEAR